MESASDRRSPAVLLVSVFALLTAGLVAYAETQAFAWDEGFHILAAQLIKHGKRPYIDFVFSQTPLNAYWNAGWMAVFGESWRVPHAMAALCSAGAAILTAGFVFSRFPVAGWRLPGAVIAGISVALNVVIVRFGGIAQAYGLGTLALTAAYCFGVRAVERRSAVFAGLAGLGCGVAAASSLLSAAASPVLLIWMLVYNRAGLRWPKLAAFVLGHVIAFLPVLWLFVQGPRQVWFCVVQYNAVYRQSDWPGALRHNLEIFTIWIDCGPALLLLLLAAGGLLFIYFRSGWEPQRKAEYYLCAWLSGALGVYISMVRPTFSRYYIFAIPFVAILAVAGLYAAGSSLYKADRPWLPVAVLALLLSFGLAKSLYEERDNMAWADLEKTARKVKEVSRAGQRLYADEAIYFLTGHEPPSGMEMENSHKFQFAPAELKLLHLIPQAELNRQVQAGAFDTLETCADDDDIKERGYAKVYAKSAAAGECNVFWNKR